MYRIIIQHAASPLLAPKSSLLRSWAKHTLKEQIAAAEITIRIVDDHEMSQLNSQFRQKQGSTNVLSFPLDIPTTIKMERPILGDIVICANVVNHEAALQKKSPEAHWAHMIVHGIFHLLGFDHENDQEAAIMENLEIKMMCSLGFSNPYEHGENIKKYD